MKIIINRNVKGQNLEQMISMSQIIIYVVIHKNVSKVGLGKCTFVGAYNSSF